MILAVLAAEISCEQTDRQTDRQTPVKRCPRDCRWREYKFGLVICIMWWYFTWLGVQTRNLFSLNASLSLSGAVQVLSTLLHGFSAVRLVVSPNKLNRLRISIHSRLSPHTSVSHRRRSLTVHQGACGTHRLSPPGGPWPHWTATRLNGTGRNRELEPRWSFR